MYCANCGKEIQGNSFQVNNGKESSIVCECCYRNFLKTNNTEKSHKWIQITNLILTGILVCLVSVCMILNFTNNSIANVNSNTKEETEREKQIAKDTLKLSEIELKHDTYSDKIYCDVTNKSNENLGYISIKVLCYDVLDNYIGSASFYESFLPSNETITLDSYAVDGTKRVEVYQILADYE